MKIDDIIRKCIEIPGISLKRSNYSAELLFERERRKGLHDLFPALSWNYCCLHLCKFTHLDSAEFFAEMAP